MRLDIFIILLIAVILLYRWTRKASEEKGDELSSDEPSSTEMVLDPNCSTYVPETEAIKTTIAGRDYCFCSEKCAEIYRKKKSAV